MSTQSGHRYGKVLPCRVQGRKSMFKHGGGDNIGEKYIPLAGCIARLSRGVRGHAPREKYFKWSNLVRFGVYLYQILSLKNFKNCYFLYKIFINYIFFL